MNRSFPVLAALPLFSAALLGGCHARLTVPDLGGRAGPFFPAPPETPRVAYVGAITGPSGTLRYPLDVACGPAGTLAVADPNAGTVWTFDLRRRRMDALRSVGGAPLSSPVGVAYDSSGALYVVDSARALVARWSRGHAEILAVGAPLQRPVATAPLPDGGFLVADTAAHTLFRMIPGVGLLELGAEAGKGGAVLNAPTDVLLGPDGAPWVCDALEGTVLRISDGSVVPVAGVPGVGGAGLVRPKGLAFAPDGNLHVVDAGMQHVQVFGADGRLLGRYGHPGEGPAALGLPGGICFGEGGLAYVADPLNARIQVYAPLPEAE